MTKTTVQKPPKTINEIVEDLRSKGELDEEKWRIYERDIIGGSILRIIFFVAIVVLLTALLITLFNGSWIAAGSTLVAGLAFYLWHREVQRMKFNTMLYYNYGQKINKTIVSKKYSMKVGWEIFLQEGKTIWYGGEKDDPYINRLSQGSQISVLVYGEEKLMPYIEEINIKCNLRKEG